MYFDDESNSLHTGTGNSFNQTQRGGLEYNLEHRARLNPATFNNLSPDNRKIIVKTFSDHFRHLPTGAEVHEDTKRALRTEFEAHVKAGRLSRTDLVDVHKMIESL